MTRRISLVTLSTILFVANVSAQVHFSKDERRIITLTDERRGIDTIASYLTSADARVAWRAAIGLANIGDTSARPALIRAFDDEKRDSVRDAEAFALGVLGPNDAVYQKLTAAPLSHQRIVALARTVTSSNVDALITLLDNQHTKNSTSDRDFAEGLMRLSLRKLSSPKLFNFADALLGSPDAEARWRAAYAFARVGDSADLSKRTEKLRELTSDLGSPNVRMFAATALGKLHNAEAESLLIREYRAEQDWRVRINILNALAKLPSLDSEVFAVFRSATADALQDSANAIHLGYAAQDALGSFITSGKLRSTDSVLVRDYLDAFNGFDGRNAEVADRVRARASYFGAFLHTPSQAMAERNFVESKDPVVRALALEAAGIASSTDTDMFINMLASMPRVPAEQQAPTLIALDTMWKHATRDTAFRAALERTHAANVYRNTLIRVTGVVLNPTIAGLALQQLQDSTIIVDTFRNLASQYLLTYIKGFQTRQFRDLLLPAVAAQGWLGDRSPAMIAALKLAYDTARAWRDFELMDSIKSALRAAGAPTDKLPLAKPIVSKIDWEYLEKLPGKMLIGLEHGSMQFQLRTYEAPLTVLNMARLAEHGYFAAQQFHRVVPNFVVQTGDPTGTGYGGPEFSMRTEIAPIEYDKAGVVGMASSGKDTEGSQWFVTECPTPHLDSRYTIWGEVLSGMSDGEKIQQGDKLQSMFPMP